MPHDAIPHSTKEPKLSFIVPVYNLENYISDCVNSLLHQDVNTEQYEIIFVDDGSTDGSAGLLDQLTSLYQNVRVIHKQNGGVSSARNAGISHATGQYIWFVDGDDMIAPNCLGHIFELLDNFYPYQIKLSYKKVPENLHFNECAPFSQQYGFIEHHTCHSNNIVWGSIIRSEIIQKNGITFQENMKYGEDTLFMYYVFLYSGSHWVELKDAVYYYRLREHSAMRQVDPESMAKRTRDIMLMSYIYKNEYDKKVIADDFKLDNTKARQHLALMGAMSVLPKSSLDYKATMAALKSEKLYPFPFLWWHISDTKGTKSKIVEFVKLFFKFELLYKLYYVIIHKMTMKKFK